MELFNALGLDLKILFAQFINFAILFFVLYRFAYKPIFKFMENRKKRIENGMKDAEEADAKLQIASRKEEEIINNAKKEALKIVEKAREEGDQKRELIVEKAKDDVADVIREEKKKIKIEKAESLKEIKKEISGIVILALEKILDEKVNSETDKELIAKITKSLE